MNDNIFTVLNVLQEVELLALVDLNYPTKLDQFFIGFEFASLHAPEGADLTKQTSIRRPNEEPISERFDKLGYYSPLLLV